MDIDKNKVESFEEVVKENIRSFLIKEGAIDAHVPECPDVEEKWSMIARSYLPDGVREFNNYPVVSLGWMMFIGMAMAYYWDTDWEANSSREDYYSKLRDQGGYDNLDETVTESLLGYKGEASDKVIETVAECAARANSLLRHNGFEPGSSEAFGAYVAALHQLYLAGMAMELNALGYHMTPYGG